MRVTRLAGKGLTVLRAVVMTAVVFPVPAARLQERHSFAGVWNANLSKSRRHENHQFKSATLKFEIAGDVVTITFTGISMAGKQESGTRRLHPDGKEHQVVEAPGLIEITKWVGSHRLETIITKGGEVHGQSLYEVSSDEKTLTATLKGVDGKGRPFEQVIVFDRE